MSKLARGEAGPRTESYALCAKSRSRRHNDAQADGRAREKKIKGITRMKKEELIVSMNPLWRDLMGCSLPALEEAAE